MLDRENINRGMYDGEYFETEQKKETDPVKQGTQEAAADIPADTAAQAEPKTQGDGPIQVPTGTEDGKGAKKRGICRAKAEVLAALVICIVTAAAGAAGYGGLKQSQADGSGQPGVKASGTAADAVRTVPALMQVDRKEAKLQLEALGFSAQVEKEEHTDMEEGIVLMQEPAAGTQVEGAATVILTVSKGSKLAEVPQLLNQAREAAEALLTEAQLGCKAEEVFSDTVAAGLVVSQDVEAGEKLTKDTVISICVSKGPKPEEKPAESPNKKVQTPSVKPEKPAAPAVPNEQPAAPPAPAQPEPPQPDSGGIQEENISDDWGSVGEEDLSGDW